MRNTKTQFENKKLTTEDKRQNRIRKNPFILRSSLNSVVPKRHIQMCMDDYETFAYVVKRSGNRIILKSPMDLFIYDCWLSTNTKGENILKVNEVMKDHDPEKIEGFTYKSL